jgi:hypothetical protein
VPDLNDEDSDDDMYGPYPPDNTHPPMESDHSDGQIDEGLLFHRHSYNTDSILQATSVVDKMDMDHPSPKGDYAVDTYHGF